MPCSCNIISSHLVAKRSLRLCEQGFSALITVARSVGCLQQGIEDYDFHHIEKECSPARHSNLQGRVRTGGPGVWIQYLGVVS